MLLDEDEGVRDKAGSIRGGMETGERASPSPPISLPSVAYARVFRRVQATLRAKLRIVSIPSASDSTSPGSRPKAMFQ